MDKFNTQVRSKIMASIKSKNNISTDKRLRAYLILLGIRGWTVNNKDIIGNPDIVFRKNNIAIFLDGCFWHGCPKHFKMPSSNIDYWRPKIENNIKRDKRNRQKLHRQGWTVLRFWEHDLKNNMKRVLDRIRRYR